MRVLCLTALVLEAGFLLLGRLHDLKQNVVEFVAILFALNLIYIFACWRTIRQDALDRRTAAMIFGFGILFRLTLAGLYPSLTEDPHRYRWEGKLQAAGGNPYLASPEDPRWISLRDAAWDAVNRKDLPTAYGPVLEWVHRLTYSAVARFEPEPSRQVRLFKIPVGVFDFATAVVLALWVPGKLLIYWWSPLVVVEFWASGHNDSVLVFFLVSAVWAACAGRWAVAYGALWMASLTKFWPFLLFPLFWRRGGPLRTALAWTPLVALICLPYAAGARTLLATLQGTLAGWTNNASLFHFVHHAVDLDFERAKPIVTALVLGSAAVTPWLRLALPQSVLALITAILFLSANCFPWYLTWLVPMLALVPQPALLLWTTLVPLAYHILIPYGILGQWMEDRRLLYLEYAPVYAMLLAAPWLHRFRRSAVTPAVPCAASRPPSAAA